MAGFWRHLHRRQPAALARAGEGRHPPRDRGDRQRGVGPVGEGRGQAAVEAAGGHDARSSSSRCVDFRYITDALTPDEALAICSSERAAGERRARGRDARATATPPTRPRPAGSATPTTRSAGSCREAVARGLHALQDEGRRATSTTTSAACAIVREEIGPERRLMMDANQCWDVPQAIEHDASAGRVQPVVDRGADQPRRRPRPRRRSPGARAASASPPASSARTG